VSQQPSPGNPVGFESQIKSLFRAKDRDSMRSAFDLWSYDDVRSHANAIAARLGNGTMPCDGAWPDAHVQLFQSWIDTGLNP
jgi:hypothetical protein